MKLQEVTAVSERGMKVKYVLNARVGRNCKFDRAQNMSEIVV